MKLTKSKLKQVIMEGLFDTDDSSGELNDKLIDRFDKLLKGIEGLDTSIDYLSAVMTSSDPLSIQTSQRAIGRYATPRKRAPSSPEDVQEEKEDPDKKLKQKGMRKLGQFMPFQESSSSDWKTQIQEAITNLCDNGYKAEEIREMVESAFNIELKEVSSEKQRKWACAQMGDDFKGERKLTKKQAKEMCKSKVEK